MSADNLGRATRCLLYPSTATKWIAFGAYTAIRPLNESNSPDFLIVDHILPGGAYSFRLRHVPGTSFPLVHDLHIFISQDSGYSHPNRCIQALFGQSWHGDIIIAKYAKNKDDICHVLTYEVDMIHIILGM